ncbi:MAG: threonine synthase, partial [Gemmiger sp.]
MKYQSTRDNDRIVSSSEAIVRGLSPDGGLFVPQEFPAADLESWKDLDYPALAEKVLSGYLTDYEPAFLKDATASTYGEAFGGKAGHMEKVSDGLFSLELWHGPTCAFKDYALQLMPKLLVEAKKNLGRTETTRILVATSGDTGKAALAGYSGLEGVEIEVFYPNAGTSEIQRLQMATQQGDNVAVYAVNGNFDDAQTGVKRVFGDETVAEQLAQRNIRLSSANSINWGRLAPQIVYYFYAYFRLVERSEISMGDKVDFCVPTGNFGDILAGYYAKRMGLPVGRLVCASNRNKVLTDFITTGTYDARRAFHKTESPSMDILISSNLERLLYHMCGDVRQVRLWMQELAEGGCYTVDRGTLSRIQAEFACGYADDAEGAEELRRQYEEHHYLCDTHTAVAFRVAERCRTDVPMVVLSTASPFKFPRAVLAALGRDVPEGDFDAMRRLSEGTG